MKQFYIVFLFAALFGANVQAQEIDLVGELIDTTPTVGNAEKTKSTSAAFETAEDGEQVADDRGIFSFLNFSFIKKPLSLFRSDTEDDDADESAQSSETQKKETPLERKIRHAQEGNVDAQLALGYMYLYGENGVHADYNQAFKFYEMAALQNNPIALNNLGSLYFNGIGTPRDYLKAAQMFSDAAKYGSDDAAVNLAFIYLSSRPNESLLPETVKLFTQAAEAGNKTAQFMLGYIYYRGFLVERDFHKAGELIKKSAASGFDEGEYVLAQMYLKGEGMAQNYGNAVKSLRESLSQGNLDAMMLLGDILADGSVYPQNLQQAHIFYNIAAIDNVEGAAQKREKVSKTLKIEQLLEAQSVAESFKASPSELTSYIRQTFGRNIRRYIDDNLSKTGETL